MSNDEKKFEPPSRLKKYVPSAQQIMTACVGREVTVEPGARIVRAAYGAENIARASNHGHHRFGPPLDTDGPNGELLYKWHYLAFDETTACWESGFVEANPGAGSGFYFRREAIGCGVFGIVLFARPLCLWSLHGEQSSRLNIQDVISDRRHQACHWIGYRVREAMLSLPPEGRPDGILYPSRRNKGSAAIALADWAAPQLFAAATIRVVRFVESDRYRQFTLDPHITDPPETTWMQ